MLSLLINIDVDDLDKAVEFYRKACGFEVGRRLGADAIELLGASTPVYLLRKPAGSPAAATVPQGRDYTRHWTPVHIDFVVEDVQAATQRALAAGAVLEDAIQSRSWMHIAYLADPFGNGFCLIEFVGRGYDEIAG